jgi:hypothetical protein
MKYPPIIHATLTFALLSVAAALSPLRAGDEPTAFWVAKDGNNNAIGSKEQPFATLERARDAVRELKAHNAYPAAGVTVWIRGGVYERSETFALDARDSGQPGAPVVYAAAPGETVDLVGGRVLPASAFKKAEDRAFLDRIITPAARRKVLQTNLKDQGITDYGELVPIHAVDFGSSSHYATAPLEVFVDGKPMILSRWPNADKENPIRGTVDRVKILIENDANGKPKQYEAINAKEVAPSYEDGREKGQAPLLAWDRMKRWQSDDIWIAGGLVRGYAYTQRKIKSIDTKTGVVQLDSPVELWPSYKEKEVSPVFFQNVPEELDEPGEYYVDRKSGVLSLVPPVGWNAGSQISVSMLRDVLVAMENSSHVRLRGLTLESARSGGVYIDRGTDNVVEKCVIRNMGTVGVQIGMGWDAGTGQNNPWTPETAPNAPQGKLLPRQPGSFRHMLSTGINNTGSALNVEGGTANGVVESRIYDTGVGGVIVGGGDRKTLTPAGNFVRGCEIFRTDRRIGRYAEAILVDGVGNLVQENYLHDSKGGILYLHGNDHVVEFNEIARAVTESTDCGAVEIRQNPSQLGNIIRYNYIHSNGRGRNAQCYVIYLDNESCGVTVFGNVIANNRSRIVDPFVPVAISINGGFGHTITNNIFVDNDGARLGDGQIKTFDVFKTRKFMLEQDVNVTRPPYSTRYPEFLAIYKGGPEAKPHNKIFNNLLVGCGSGMGESRYPGEGFWHHNYETDTNPGFVDEASGDYELRQDSIVYEKIPGFQPVPFSKMQQAQKWTQLGTK